MSKDVLEPLNKLLMSGQLTQGPVVEEFEMALKKYIGNPYILTLNSATAGLTLALRLLKNKDALPNWPGFDDNEDLVLTPALTCFATTAAILANGVNIRWLDVDLETANISLEDVKKKLNEKTKVIYLVHWGGNPVDLDELDKICEEHKLKYGFKPVVVEDCAHSFGAEYNGKKIGSSKNICVFSLQAIKHLTTGDGGIITLPTEGLYERCKLLRWYGINRDKRNYKGKDFRLENDILEYGYKFHMNDINATIGLYNLPHMDELLRKNRVNGNYLDKHLKDCSGIKLMKNNPKCNSAYWLYTIRILNGKKQEFMEKMKEAGIMTSQVHNRNDINSCVKEFEEELPNLDILEKELVCIPVGWWLSEKERKYIVDNIMNKKYFCIGLHKTGTSTLHQIALNNGLKSTHSIDWQNNEKKIKLYDFFCDGGSHYNNINEIDYEYLYSKYPNSIFIINIREPRSWIISKLKHAGWHEETIVTPDNKLKDDDNKWKEKTKINISSFICHYFDRYIKMLEYFLNKQDRGYIVDIVSGKIENLRLLFDNEISSQNIHINKGNKNNLSNEIIEFIDNEINIVNKNKYEKLVLLLKQYNF